MHTHVTYIFDVDGTLTSEWYVNDNVRHLAPNLPVLGLALSISRSNLGKLVVVTARPEYLRQCTLHWLQDQGLEPEALLMRGNEDTRPDSEVRIDQVSQVVETYGNSVILLDDKISNCIAVGGSLGIPCIHIRRP